MARTIEKLTALVVERAKRRGYLGDGGGLFLQVSATGAKSWVFRFKEAGRLHEMGLGPVHTIGLAEARERAREARRLRLDGRDPIADRKAAKLAAKLEAAKAMTFRQCAERYIAAHRAGWRNPKHAAQWPATLATYVYPVFGALPVQKIDTALVMKAIELLWAAKPETASRVRGRVEAILDWATAREFRAGENPARWRGHLDTLLPKKTKVRRVEHHAALPYAEIGAFMAELRQQEGVAARCLEFTILTACRTGEAIGARWDEINLAAGLWSVPPERMKAGREHRVPMSDAVIAILEELAKVRHGDFVFPGGRAGRPISNMAMAMTLRRMGRGELTVHGFRSSFATWCKDIGVPAELREMALAHAEGDKVAAAYTSGAEVLDRRCALAERWARFCTTIPSAKVVAIR